MGFEPPLPPPPTPFLKEIFAFLEKKTYKIQFKIDEKRKNPLFIKNVSNIH